MVSGSVLPAVASVVQRRAARQVGPRRDSPRLVRLRVGATVRVRSRVRARVRPVRLGPRLQ